MIEKSNFLLDVTLVSPDFTTTKSLKLIVKLAKSNSGYGNDTYMLVKSRDSGSFEQYYDIRYDKEFNKNKPEVFIINWVYNFWSGENGSWNIIGCSIKVQGGRKQLKGGIDNE